MTAKKSCKYCEYGSFEYLLCHSRSRGFEKAKASAIILSPSFSRITYNLCAVETFDFVEAYRPLVLRDYCSRKTVLLGWLGEQRMKCRLAPGGLWNDFTLCMILVAICCSSLVLFWMTSNVIHVAVSWSCQKLLWWSSMSERWLQRSLVGKACMDLLSRCPPCFKLVVITKGLALRNGP